MRQLTLSYNRAQMKPPSHLSEVPSDQVPQPVTGAEAVDSYIPKITSSTPSSPLSPLPILTSPHPSFPLSPLPTPPSHPPHLECKQQDIDDEGDDVVESV